MDLRAVKEATSTELAAAAAAAARNADDLVRDAEILAEAHRTARACSLATLAVEEVGKAAGLVSLAAMPRGLKAQAPVGLVLEWHQLKQSLGLLVAELPYGAPGFAAKLLAMPEDDLARLLDTLELPADEADQLKRGGFYVDIGHGGRLRDPSEITETQVACQLDRARLAAGSARILLDPKEQARVASPTSEEVELTRVAVEVLTKAEGARTPGAAADIVNKTIGKLRERLVGAPQLGVLLAA